MKNIIERIMKSLDINEALREEITEEEYDYDSNDVVHHHHIWKLNDDQ